MGTLDSFEVPPHEKDPVLLVARLRRMLGFLMQLDLRAAERTARLEPKVCSCSLCGCEKRARDFQRVKGRPVCTDCNSDRWNVLLQAYTSQG